MGPTWDPYVGGVPPPILELGLQVSILSAIVCMRLRLNSDCDLRALK